MFEWVVFHHTNERLARGSDVTWTPRLARVLIMFFWAEPTSRGCDVNQITKNWLVQVEVMSSALRVKDTDERLYWWPITTIPANNHARLINPVDTWSIFLHENHWRCRNYCQCSGGNYRNCLLSAISARRHVELNSDMSTITHRLRRRETSSQFTSGQCPGVHLMVTCMLTFCIVVAGGSFSKQMTLNNFNFNLSNF